MDLRLNDRVIFVTGASQGIGLGIVETCLREGARVAFTARGAEKLEMARDRLREQYGHDRVWAEVGDMRDSAVVESSVARVEAELGPIWGAVANVGGYRTKPGFDIPDEMWEASVAQNLSSAQRLARSVLGKMTARKEGVLLLMASIAGLKVFGTPIAYGTPKAAVIQLGKELARLVGKDGIRVNTIAPGNIIFPGGYWENIMNSPDAPKFQQMLDDQVALARFGTAAEIGSLAAYLLSPLAGFVTGATFVADGGQIL